MIEVARHDQARCSERPYRRFVGTTFKYERNVMLDKECRDVLVIVIGVGLESRFDLPTVHFDVKVEDVAVMADLLNSCGVSLIW